MGWLYHDSHSLCSFTHPSNEITIQGCLLLCSSIITVNEFNNKRKIDDSCYWLLIIMHYTRQNRYFDAFNLQCMVILYQKTFHTWCFDSGFVVSFDDDELIINWKCRWETLLIFVGICRHSISNSLTTITLIHEEWRVLPLSKNHFGLGHITKY